MSTVTAREANQHFSKILDAAARGEEVTITRRGKPVAKLVPVASQEETAAAAAATARRAALERPARGYPGKAVEPWTRDELYDDRIERPRQPDDTCDRPWRPTFWFTRPSETTAATRPPARSSTVPPLPTRVPAAGSA